MTLKMKCLLLNWAARLRVGTRGTAKYALARLLANPLVGAASTSLGVLAGVLASIHPDEIANSLHFISAERAFAPWATLFWLMVILFGLFFGGSQWANLTLSEAGQARLKSAVDELRALPERGFLALFDENFRDAYEAVRVTARRGDRDSLAYAIRVILDSIISLAVTYDKAPPEIIYAANIMIFRSSENLNEGEKKRLGGCLRFGEPGKSLSDYAGVLELVPELSTTTAMAQPTPDVSLQTFCLPVPKSSPRNANDATFRDVLPGAPAAFFDRAAVSFKDYSKIREVLDSVGDFPPSLKAEIIRYFSSEAVATVQSFVSLPLYAPRGKEWKADPIGILNIHRNQVGILANGFDDMFVPLSVPFRAALTEVLSRWVVTYTSQAS